MRTRWTAALSGLVSITDRLNCEGLPLNKYQGLREELEDVEGKGNSGPCSNQSSPCSDSQARQVTSADPRNNI